MGLRLLLAARKSRKADDAELYERQDYRAKEWAERAGHAIIHATADTVSSQTAPWKRRGLGPWMTDPVKLARYDAILVSETDRVSRGTDEDWHDLEGWCYRNKKPIIVADGPQFPPREGPMGDSDRYQWIAQKRAARTYWESVRDKHADTWDVIKANGAAIGKPPFGYRTQGPKLHKTFVIDSVNGPLALQAFQRIASGRTATSVAIWLTEVTGRPWRVKRVTDMIGRTTYLGERDGHTFKALLSEELWDSANAALAARSFKRTDTGGRRTEYGYSGLIYCECGAQLYRHQSSYNGKAYPERYRCGRGRTGDFTETRCAFRALDFEAANTAVDALMSGDHSPEWVMVTTGGDHGRQMELERIQGEMNTAMAHKDMKLLTALAAKFSEVDAKPPEPVRTVPKRTGRTKAEAWITGTLADQRAILGDRRITVLLEPDGTVRARLEDDEE